MITTRTSEDAIGIEDKRNERDFQQYVSYLKRGQKNT